MSNIYLFEDNYLYMSVLNEVHVSQTYTCHIPNMYLNIYLFNILLMTLLLT